MNDVLSPGDVNIYRMQILAIIGSSLLFLFILFLIRKKKIKEEFSLIWLFFSIVFIVFSVWRQGLDVLSDALGIAYPPTAILLLLLMAMFMILIQFSILISSLAERNKKMAQEIALLRLEMEKIRDKKA